MHRSDNRDYDLNDTIERIKVNLNHEHEGSLLDDGSPKAAVSMILKHDQGEENLRVLFVKRQEREGDPWSGHMAFPGGRRSEKDRTLLETVVRETMEETAIDLRNGSILGTLEDVLSGNRSVRVRPFVFLSPNNPIVKINTEEIDKYFWIPLSFFAARENSHPYTVERFGMKMQVPSYKFNGEYVVWGMTLRIIQDFISKVHPEPITSH